MTKYLVILREEMAKSNAIGGHKRRWKRRFSVREFGPVHFKCPPLAKYLVGLESRGGEEQSDEQGQEEGGEG